MVRDYFCDYKCKECNMMYVCSELRSINKLADGLAEFLDDWMV